jgi:hypothetical protein
MSDTGFHNYNETRLSRTTNKAESCINQAIHKVTMELLEHFQQSLLLKEHHQ